MKKLKLLFLSSLLILFTACGTEIDADRGIVPDRGFDMWEYMTSTLNYEVEYAIYENNVKRDYYVETHKMYRDEYVRESSAGITILFLNGNTIIMKEPSNEVSIERYVYLGDRGVFQSSSIHSCSVERFYKTYRNKGKIFNNVLRIGCTSNRGVEQEFYYGYNEGIVSIYKNDGVNETEWVKVREEAIF